MNENELLVFCSQFNRQSRPVPNSGLFCGHNWDFKHFSRQVVDYGGVMVYGKHGHWKCSWCGKNRMKVFKGDEYKVYSRRDLENLDENGVWKKVPKYKQLEFI